MQIPFFNYSALHLQEQEKIKPVIKDVLSRGAYILQKDLEDFENSLARYCKVKHAIGVANGTDALWLSLIAAGIGQNDEVILPSHTYVASPASIRFVGATPILVDCNEDHLIDPDSIKRSINSKTKAIMPVQLNGRTCDMDYIQEIASSNDLLIIEDSAQGLGSLLNGKMAGTFGLAGTYSFYPAKVLGCYGDGGAVVTNDDDIASKIRLLRDHGRDDNGEFITWGVNSRLDNLQAAILNEKLKYFNNDIAKRRKIASIYCDILEGNKNINTPPPPNNESNFDTFQNFEIRAKQRDQLKKYLYDNSIGTIIQWGGKAVHQEKKLGLTNFRLPKTDALFEECLMLPMNTSINDSDAEYVANKVNEFYG